MVAKAKKDELIERIRNLSEKELEEVAPYLEADLNAALDLEALYAEVIAGKLSSQNEPLIDNDEVAKRVDKLLARKP